MRICLVYDCLFPHTVGGAERWYRNLGERLAADGHDVTYLTLRQWDRGEDPGVPGVRVIAVGPRMALYAGGRRRILPPVVFGLGVLWHLVRHGRRYDVVHTASFPYFSLLVAGALRRLCRYRLVVDWHEVWSRDYWIEYLGARAGLVGAAIQQICVHIAQHAFCFSRLHAERLSAAGLRGEVTVLEGEYTPKIPSPARPRPAEPVVVFAGRHIPEKRAPAVVGAVMDAARRVPGLRGIIFGDGPERGMVLQAIDDAGAQGTVSAPGFVDAEEVDTALGTALCMLLPSRREGYGLIVVEGPRRRGSRASSSAALTTPRPSSSPKGRTGQWSPRRMRPSWARQSCVFTAQDPRCATRRSPGMSETHAACRSKTRSHGSWPAMERWRRETRIGDG